MAEPQIRHVSTPAMQQELMPITFSTKTWLTIYAVLKGHATNGNLAGMRTWAADHIMHQILVRHEMIDEVDDDRPGNAA